MSRVRYVCQIEMTSRCNLRCRYCIHPKMPRAKLDMDAETYALTLGWARRLRGRQLSLAGIGESTLHPEFVRNVFLAREAVGPGVELLLATNGLLMDAAMAAEIAPSRIAVWVSLHRPESAGPAVEALKRAGIFAGLSADPALAAIDWAGQVKWHVSTPARGSACPWLQGAKVCVLADGRVARCCLDAVAADVLGTVRDDVAAMRTGPYALCEKCHHDAWHPSLNERWRRSETQAA